MNEEDIFHEALARNPADRSAYLDGACEGNPALRASLDVLLRANVGATGFLIAPAQDATIDLPPATEGPGTVIGPYKLLEQIGFRNGLPLIKGDRVRLELRNLRPADGLRTRHFPERIRAVRNAIRRRVASRSSP